MSPFFVGYLTMNMQFMFYAGYTMKHKRYVKQQKNNLTTQQNICNIINVKCNKDTAMWGLQVDSNAHYCIFFISGVYYKEIKKTNSIHLEILKESEVLYEKKGYSNQKVHVR